MDLKSEETKQRLNVDLSCQCQILISIYFISPSSTGNLYKKSDLLNKYRDLLRYIIFISSLKVSLTSLTPLAMTTMGPLLPAMVSILAVWAGRSH